MEAQIVQLAPRRRRRDPYVRKLARSMLLLLDDERAGAGARIGSIVILLLLAGACGYQGHPGELRALLEQLAGDEGDR